MGSPLFRKGQQRIVTLSAMVAGGLSVGMLGQFALTGFAQGAAQTSYFLQGPLCAALMLALSLALFKARHGLDRPASWSGPVLAGLAACTSLVALAGHALRAGPAWMVFDGAHLSPLLRLSVLTSCSILAIALACLAAAPWPGASWQRRQFGALLAMVPMCLGTVMLMSYPEGRFILDGSQGPHMTLPSALDSLLLGLAALMGAGFDTWPLALFSSASTAESTDSRRLRLGPLRVFLVLTLSILCLGSMYLRGQVKAARVAAEKDLDANAEGKAREIGLWFRELQGDAEQLATSPLLQDGFARCLEGGAGEQPALLEWMASLSRRHGYRRVELYDTKGSLRLALPGMERHQLSSSSLAALQEALAARGPKLVDLHEAAISREVHMGFWIPVGMGPDGHRPPTGAVHLQMDAREFLFPLLGAATHSGSSAEVILVRREGDAAMALSDLNGRPDAARKLRRLGSNPGPLHVALGQQGASEGLDDQGRPVVTAVRQVPGTPWSLVIQVDQTEVFGTLRPWGRMIAAGLFGLVLMLAMGLGLLVRHGDTRKTMTQLAFERERKALSDRFAKAMATSPDGMAINRLDDGVYLDINHGFTRITGYTAEDLLGRSSREEDLSLWVHNEDRDRMVRAIQAHGELVDLEAPFKMKDGTIIIGLMSGKLLDYENVACIITSTRNITPIRLAEEERRTLEAQLHQAQKLESLGALAGGVAHDMNNVLGAILSLASARSTQLGAGHDLTSSFDTIVKACLRGRGVVRSLLYFARKDLQNITPVNLNDLILEVTQLLSHTTLQRMKLETHLREDLWTVQADAGALTHAIMNLCVNAMDAMPGGGTLRLETGNLQDGRVQLAVTDTGEGMSDEVQFRAVEPFFTTKPVGKGTGLGLAMVFGTMKAHGGGLEIRSQVGAGTTITLTFPRFQEEPEPSQLEASPALAAGQSLSILLVDDDEFILESVELMLGSCGHTVRTAQGGQEALACLDQPADVDLVILDLNMPGMNGAETLTRILAERPRQRILLASGYHDGEISQLLAGRPGVGFLQKPFSMAEFLRKTADMGI